MPTPVPADAYYTVSSMARLLGVSRPTVYAMERDGRLPKRVRVGGRWVWRAVDIELLVAECVLEMLYEMNLAELKALEA